jgi:hypothetical protein
MVEGRRQADCVLVAELTGEARFRARWRELTAEEERAAASALRELAAGRADLLAEVAGLLEGASEGELEEPLARQAAVLCWLAGARRRGGPGVDRGGAAPGDDCAPARLGSVRERSDSGPAPPRPVVPRRP